MKKIILLIAGALIWHCTILAQTKVKSYLIDFGPEGNTANCKPTSSPDINGLYWNNFTGNSDGSTLQLNNTTGDLSDLFITTVQSFEVNPGDLMGPLTTSDELKELAIGTATMDFFFAQNSHPSLKISGLDPRLGYRFYLYGSRLNDEKRVTKYSLKGSNTATGHLQTSGKDLESGGINGNITKAYITPMLFADGEGNIFLEVANETSAFGYLNALKIESYSDAKIEVQDMTLQGKDINTLGGTSQLTATILPADASIQAISWLVSDPSVATIDQNGLLKAHADGTVVVTATSQDNNTVKASITLHISGQKPASNLILIDFGPAGNTDNCKPTDSPDANGHFWNNITDNKANAVASLTDIKGNSTALKIKNLGEFGANPDALMGPLEVSQDLQQLAVSTATMDFFFVENKTTSFQISGLDPDKGYRFTLFGSRITTEKRVTGYTFTGITSINGSLQTSGSGLGGENNPTNISQTYLSPIIYPNTDGEITLDVKNNTSAYGYLNAMKLEIFENIKVPVDHIELSGHSISEPDGTTEIKAAVYPENATVKAISWQVDNPAIAVIDSTGLLKAMGNGTVRVTATSKDNPEISASVTIEITHQPEPKQSVLIDFGPEGDTQNCKPTASPDMLGHFWNNYTGNNEGASLPLVDILEKPTGLTLHTTKTFSVNPGDLMGPTAVSALLGPLSIGTATMDFFFVENNTGILSIEGLEPLLGYRLQLYGSRIQSEVRKTAYQIKGLSTFVDTLQTSGQSLEGEGINGNISRISSTPIIFADSSGKIQITVANAASTFGYLNALRLESFEVNIVEARKIEITGDAIEKPGGSSQMHAKVSPDNATIQEVYWSVDDSSIATIDENGLLKAVGNGMVTVTAKSKLFGSTTEASQKIKISHQFKQLYISGSALADNDDSTDFNAMRLLKSSTGLSKGVFEFYTRLNATGHFYFQTENNPDAVRYGMGSTADSLKEGGSAFTSPGASIVLIRVDMSNQTLQLTPIEEVTVNGQSGNVSLQYDKAGIWSAQVAMDKVISSDDKNFVFQLNRAEALTLYHASGTDDRIITLSESQRLGYGIEKIPTDLNTYNLTLDLNSQTYSIACASLNSKKITIMGSSVAFGFGATDNHGYNYLFGQLLDKRYQQQGANQWDLVNKAISGNNTINVLDRWNRDLASGCGKYVIIGLSLGNEGIHESQNKEATFNQFKENLLKMMALARAQNMVPVINNNYTRSDYTPEDYSYIKRMDLFIHELDAPSMNLLGAIDDGQGRWVQGYKFDDLHPNDLGHLELMYTIVPSLFDALDAGKALPQRQATDGISLNNKDSITQVYFTPEEIVHSFTFSIAVKTKGAGPVAYFSQGDNKGSILLDTLTGAPIYMSPDGQTIRAATSITDDSWHTITLTHFYARGYTALFIDGKIVGKVNEKLLADNFYLNDPEAAEGLSFKDLFFYRAGMSPEAIAALQDGEMLKSSLEIYAPFSGGSMENLAQSTNILKSQKVAKGTDTTPQAPDQEDPDMATLILYPNPVADKLQFKGLAGTKTYQCVIYNIMGNKVYQTDLWNGQSVKISQLPAGKYFLQLSKNENGQKRQFSFIKK